MFAVSLFDNSKRALQVYWKKRYFEKHNFKILYSSGKFGETRVKL